MNLPEHLRNTRKNVVPGIIEYRTTDPRVVDAVRLLDVAADTIEQLQYEVTKLRQHGDKMANALNMAAKKGSGQDNAVDGLANKYAITCLYLDRGERDPEYL